MMRHKTKTVDEELSSWRHVFFGNPLQMETVRFGRRFLRVTESQKLNKGFVWTVGACYFIVLAILSAVAADVSMFVILMLQQLLAMVCSAVIAHGAIAGERDRRSWDLLQVAPITQYQIVIGKFLCSLKLLVLLQVATLPFAFVCLLWGPSRPELGHASLANLATIEILCLSISCFLSSLTLYLSSRLKSANATLVTGIATTVGIYVLVPLAIRAIWPNATLEYLLHYNPFWWILRSSQETSSLWEALSYTLVYFALAAWMLIWSGHSLTKNRYRE